MLKINNNSGLFDITLVAWDAYGCSDTITKPQFINVSLGLFELNMNSSIKAYPNPFSSMSNIEITSDVSTEAFISVVNELGQVVYQNKQWINEGKNEILINSNSMNLAPGNYYFTIVGDNLQGGTKLTIVK